MLLLKTGESLVIKIDCFNKILKPILSRYRIVKLKLLLWLCNKRGFEAADGLYSIVFNVICPSADQILG